MPHPNPAEMPSEHTIEVMGNHCLLEALGNPHAWMYCPTTNQELILGFDAALQGMKSLVMQYKGLHYVYAGGHLHVKVPVAQRAALVAACPPTLGRPYVFYVVSRAPTYGALQIACAAAPPTFFDGYIFVDAHTIPANADRLRVAGMTVQAFNKAVPLAPNPTAYTNDQVVAGIAG